MEKRGGSFHIKKDVFFFFFAFFFFVFFVFLRIVAITLETNHPG